MFKYTIKYSTKLNPKSKLMIEQLHYLKSSRCQPKHVFELYLGNHFYGVCVFGTPVGVRCNDKIELRRLVLNPKACKNTASWFMSRCLNQLKGMGITNTVISYADPREGHTGGIYKACNFNYIGTQKYTQKGVMINNRFINARGVYQRHNGIYDKAALKYQDLLKRKIIKWIKIPPKHIFEYKLKK